VGKDLLIRRTSPVCHVRTRVNFSSLAIRSPTRWPCDLKIKNVEMTNSHAKNDFGGSSQECLRDILNSGKTTEGEA
jgi:hypothetical protein